MFKRFLILGLLALWVMPITAQETRTRAENELVIGEVVTGEITDAQFEVFYKLQAEQGQVLVIEMFAAERDNDLDWPELVLYDGDNQTIADTFSSISINRAVLVVEMPHNGSYQVIATRDDGRSGDSVGEYVLRVLAPPVLQSGETVTDVVLGEGPVNYYVVESDTAFSVYYEFSNGNFRPILEAYRVEDDYDMINLATLRGRELANGTVGFRNTEGSRFVITIGDSPYASSFNDEIRQANYRVRLLVNE